MHESRYILFFTETNKSLPRHSVRSRNELIPVTNFFRRCFPAPDHPYPRWSGHLWSTYTPHLWCFLFLTNRPSWWQWYHNHQDNILHSTEFSPSFGCFSSEWRFTKHWTVIKTLLIGWNLCSLFSLIVVSSINLLIFDIYCLQRDKFLQHISPHPHQRHPHTVYLSFSLCLSLHLSIHLSESLHLSHSLSSSPS